MVYEIPKEQRILKAFEYAGEKVPKTIRLKDLRKVCKKNLKDWKVPIEYQYVWYCLHNLRINRKFENGKITNSKVSFHPISVKLNDRLFSLLEKVTNKIGIEYFAKLCCVSSYTIVSWLNRIYNAQIVAILKACQILNKDPWMVLDGCSLNGWGSSRSFLFKFKESNELLDLIPWIANEGHMQLGDPTILIKQHKTGLGALKKLIKICIGLNIGTNLLRLKGSESNLYLLQIYSAVLRQILVLRYHMDIGYKCRTVNFTLKNLNKKQKLRILARDYETDGCFTTDLRHGVRFPKYDFSSQSYRNILRVKKLLEEFGYNPMKIMFTGEAYRLTLKRVRENIKLAREIYPYLIHEGKKINLMKSLSDIGLRKYL